MSTNRSCCEGLVVSPCRERWRQSSSARSTLDIDVVCELQLDERAAGESVPVDEAVGLPWLAIDLHALCTRHQYDSRVEDANLWSTHLDKDVPASAVLRIAAEAIRANRGGRLEHRILERNLTEVGRRQKELSCRRKRIETCQVESDVAAHGAGVYVERSAIECHAMVSKAYHRCPEAHLWTCCRTPR